MTREDRTTYWQKLIQAQAESGLSVRIPADFVQLFRANPSTHSDPFRPLIPF